MINSRTSSSKALLHRPVWKVSPTSLARRTSMQFTPTSSTKPGRVIRNRRSPNPIDPAQLGLTWRYERPGDQIISIMMGADHCQWRDIRERDHDRRHPSGTRRRASAWLAQMGLFDQSRLRKPQAGADLDVPSNVRYWR